MPSYPRYGRNLPKDFLVSHPQISELHAKGLMERTSSFQLREIGRAYIRLPRAVPTSYYLPGAPIRETERTREDNGASVPLASDTGQ